jgi:hypothetical protein
VNWEGWGGAVEAYFKALSRYSSGGTEENHEEPQGVLWMYYLKFELDTPRIHIRSVTI